MNENNRYISEWIEKADHDLGSAKIIFIHIPDYFDTISYHCQQAVEKYLKALLIYNNIDFQRTHNLIFLLDLLSQKLTITEGLYDKAIILNGYGVQIRYPDSKIYLSKDEVSEAIEISEEFRKLVVNLLNIEGID